jgi:hypothetical protein
VQLLGEFDDAGFVGDGNQGFHRETFLRIRIQFNKGPG